MEKMGKQVETMENDKNVDKLEKVERVKRKCGEGYRRRRTGGEKGRGVKMEGRRRGEKL